MNVCAFCGTEKNVREFYECACDEHSEVVFICEKCKKKYLEFVKDHPVGRLGFSTFRQHILLTLKKESTTMQVSYNGFTGELVKLERVGPLYGDYFYNLSIYDSEKQVTHSFTGVKLEDVKFLGGAVAFGG